CGSDSWVGPWGVGEGGRGPDRRGVGEVVAAGLDVVSGAVEAGGPQELPGTGIVVDGTCGVRTAFEQVDGAHAGRHRVTDHRVSVLASRSSVSCLLARHGGGFMRRGHVRVRVVWRWGGRSGGRGVRTIGRG